jgi:hypothetical protein
MWRILGSVGLALLVVGFAGLFVMFGDAGNLALVVAVLATFFGQAALAGFCLHALDEEIGVTGHFAWYPGPARHKATIEVEKPQLSHLVCRRCGHGERYWVASARSEAEERMRGHVCL